ncbi:restriction endonuclease [Adlercreutzia muris]
MRIQTLSGGIDGVIREDKLGFENIYIQAKRWDLNASVGRPDLCRHLWAL